MHQRHGDSQPQCSLVLRLDLSRVLKKNAMTNLVGIIKKDGQVVPFESDNVIVEFDSEFSKGNEILIHEPFNINRLVIYVKGDNNKILIGGGACTL